MRPIQISAMRQTTVYQFGRAQSTVETTADMMMMVPPMVGVPALVRWVSGPKSRTICPTFNRVSHRIVAGPRTKATSRAVTSPPADRTVTYWKRLKKMCTSLKRER